MTSISKFTDEELNEIENIQDKYQEVTARLGQISVERVLLEQKSEELTNTETIILSDLKTLQKQEKDMHIKLKEKYGQGTLNLQTGEFISTEIVKQ